ncbi:MAG: hypothetical protein ACREH4_09125 [Vitreimonas sp.]
MADNDSHAGAFSGLAAGILVIALTVMAFFAFQPQHAASMRAPPADSAAVSVAN